MRKTGWRRVGITSAMVGMMILTSGCAETMGSGDAGCISYGEARLAMPVDRLPGPPWGRWIADTDDRMTGTCR